MQMPILMEGHSRLLASAHGLDVYYRLFYGTVKYPSEQRIALVVMLQQGGTENFEEALAKGEVLTTQPAVVLDEDLSDVLAAIEEIKQA